MTTRRVGLLLISLIATCGILGAQDAPVAEETDNDPSPPEMAEPLTSVDVDSADSESTPDVDTAADPSATLYSPTLRRDIETAGFYELLDWLESLDQSTAGDKSALVRRLLEYYSLPVETEPGEDEDETPLIVDSATRTRYFTLSDIDERYVRLSGGVTLILRDEERNVTHEIVADEVTYNQDLNVISASGDVIYTLDRAGTVEQFSGAALTVQLDDWDGAFVQGVTERPRTIDGTEVDFSFEGSYITRSSNDVVVMEDGRVTSSKADPPNYEIRADKIWVLAPGEWGLRNAYLYVGRVRVFYFPFFFRPGNKLFFNPSVGVREREGTYVQTTTYLMGEPEVPESAFSFLQIAEEQTGPGSKTIEGLYLVPDEESSANAAETGPDAAMNGSGRNDSTLRLLADIYSKLGAYVAVDGSFPDAGPLRNLKVYLGLGASRHIFRYTYPGQGVTYSPYQVIGGDATTSWNGTQIGSVRLPVRFGLGLSAALQGGAFSLSGDFPYYSDSRFAKDFDRRSEQIDWLGLVGQGSPLPEAGLVRSFEWRLRSSWSPQLPAIQPWLQRAQIQNASVVLRWREKTIQPPPPIVAAADASPEAGFYYPDTLQMPTVAAVLSGQLWNLSSTAASEPETEIPPENMLRPPWEVLHFEPLAEDEYLRLPARPGSLPATRIPEEWNTALSYTISPSGTLENIFESDEWTEPASVDFATAYSAASGRVAASLPLTANLLSGALMLNGTITGSGQYRAVFNQSDTVDETEWGTLEDQAASYSSVNASGTFSARARPFQGSDLWANSSVNYTVNLLLYQLVYSPSGGTGSPPLVADWGPIFDQHLAQWISWDEQFVRSHQLQLSAALDVWSGQALRLTVDLPPRPSRFVGQLDLGYTPVSVSVASGVVEQSEDTWVVQPLTSVQTLTLGELGQIQNQVSFDIDNAELSYNTTSAAVGPVKASFDVRTTEGYNFGGAGVGWTGDGERRFQPTRAELSANFDSELEPLWRNRLLVSGSLATSWSMNLLRYTESSFAFGLSAEAEITDFLTVSFSSRSVNTQSYVYIGSLAEGVGRQRRSLLGDLLQSFNFFSRQARIGSAFNLQQIRIDATHNLEDWDLIVGYGGQPEIVVVDPGTPDERREYDWQSTLDIELQWRAIRELSSSVRADNRTDTLSAGEGGWDLTFGNDS